MQMIQTSTIFINFASRVSATTSLIFTIYSLTRFTRIINAKHEIRISLRLRDRTSQVEWRTILLPYFQRFFIRGHSLSPPTTWAELNNDQ